MEYRSKYKAEEIEAILDAKNNTGEGVDSNLDGLFVGQLQTKEVEVSEDTTIKADEGFLGLKEVSVKVNAGGGSASSWRYFDVSQQNEINTLLITLSAQLKGISNNQKILGPAQFMNIQAESIISAAIDFSQKIKLVGAPTVLTIEEMVTLQGMPIGMATEITEEEFYAL